MKNQTTIDAFVNIIDNFGDMGFAAEFCLYYQKNYKNFFFHIFTNECEILENFFKKNNLDNVKIYDIKNFEKKSEIGISFLHADFPKKMYKNFLRIDYITFDKKWLESNLSEHILSEKNYKITEIIPSPIHSGSGILPKIPNNFDKKYFTEKYGIFRENKKNFSIFCYGDTLEKIDWTSIENNVEIIIFGAKNPEKIFTKIPKNVIIMPFVSIEEMYAIFDFSDYIVTRGEISFMQVLQLQKPFLWDIYHTIGGFPTAQSEDFLEYIGTSEKYKNFSKKMWHASEKISILEMMKILDNEREVFVKEKNFQNICEEVKKNLTK